MITSFLTITGSATGEYKEKGSKFLAFAYPVSDENSVKSHLAALRKKYFDARHHCYAYVLGTDKSSVRANDDGEPNHSAGDPILGQIRSRNLTHVLVVVIRYFGGTKLGVGGLIAAYKIAAEAALNNATIIEEQVKIVITFSYGYDVTPVMMKLIKDFELTILTQEFGEMCVLQTQALLSVKEVLLEKIRLLNATGSVFETILPE